MSKFVGAGPSSYKKKRIYRAAVSQMLGNTALLNISEGELLRTMTTVTSVDKRKFSSF